MNRSSGQGGNHFLLNCTGRRIVATIDKRAMTRSVTVLRAPTTDCDTAHTRRGAPDSTVAL